MGGGADRDLAEGGSRDRADSSEASQAGARERPLAADVAIRASEIDNPTGDPVDRLIVATALVADAVLLTADGSLLAWPGQVRRQDAQR
jgi:PIN domain nuclease of toxin-antitoxin system